MQFYLATSTLGCSTADMRGILEGYWLMFSVRNLRRDLKYSHNASWGQKNCFAQRIQNSFISTVRTGLQAELSRKKRIYQLRQFGAKIKAAQCSIYLISVVSYTNKYSFISLMSPSLLNWAEFHFRPQIFDSCCNKKQNFMKYEKLVH